MHAWKLSKKCGPNKDAVDAFKLELSQGFAYCILLGEMMYDYITCRPDISFASTTMSKFSTKPSKYHYELLKSVAKYLQETKELGIKYTRSVKRNDLSPASLISDAVVDEKLPPFPVDINPPKLMVFVGVTYANNQRKLWWCNCIPFQNSIYYCY